MLSIPPRKQFVDPIDLVVGNPCQNIGSQACGSMPLSFAVSINV
jgi:hypothetical protein